MVQFSKKYKKRKLAKTGCRRKVKVKNMETLMKCFSLFRLSEPSFLLEVELVPKQPKQN